MSAPSDRALVEAACWALPALAASAVFLRSPRGGRASWAVVAGACAAIVADKLVDLQIRLYRLGKELVAGADPELRLRGEHLWLRLLLLGGLFVAGAFALRFGARLDRRPGRGKRVALAGLVLVLAFLGARLVPALKPHFAPPRDVVLEGLTWLVVVAGVLVGWSEAARPPPESA